MADRRLAERQVISVMNRPGSLRTSERYPDRRIAERTTSDGNIIRIVYVEELEIGGRITAHVLTAMRQGGK